MRRQPCAALVKKKPKQKSNNKRLLTADEVVEIGLAVARLMRDSVVDGAGSVVLDNSRCCGARRFRRAAGQQSWIVQKLVELVVGGTGDL